MRVKVLTDFRDRENNLKLQAAETVIEVTKERAKKLMSLRLVEAVPEQKKETNKKAAT